MKINNFVLASSESTFRIQNPWIKYFENELTSLSSMRVLFISQSIFHEYSSSKENNLVWPLVLFEFKTNFPWIEYSESEPTSLSSMRVLFIFTINFPWLEHFEKESSGFACNERQNRILVISNNFWPSHPVDKTWWRILLLMHSFPMRKWDGFRVPKRSFPGRPAIDHSC